MLCDNCRENDGIVRLTTVKDGVMTQLFLCERCAAERGVETTASASKNPLGEFLQTLQHQKATPGGGDDSSTCPFCGATTRDFRATGRLGCAHCYGAFERSLRELLRRVHGNSRHVGNRYDPPRPETMERASTLGELRDRLRRAIEQEQFELAADIRDRIRVLE